jgi:hypothetical protein
MKNMNRWDDTLQGFMPSYILRFNSSLMLLYYWMKF